MTTILAAFVIAFALSLGITPLVKNLGRRFGAMDQPDERKVHLHPLPRIGGAAVLLAFLITVFISTFFNTNISNQLALTREHLSLLAGGLICFGVGIADDFRRVNHRIKFLFQILGASVAFWGGIRITVLFYDFSLAPGFILPLVTSYGVTVFWFLLFINAVNLIDGLDGLAVGISLFTCLVLVIFLCLKDQYLIAMLYVALAGASLGFLRYNFNPATIFLGDGGAYFLGYTIAGLSILGSVKTSLGAAILIPLLAMGVPVFDTIFSPVRRFIRGQDLFKPDKGHIHHRLVKIGFAKNKAVLLIYGISIILCMFAVILVNVRDKRAGLFLIILGISSIVFARKLGYFEYVAVDKLYGWFRDIQDVAGISRDRRSFLSLQIEISESGTMEVMWQNVCRALERLQFVRAELTFSSREDGEREKKKSDGYTGVERRMAYDAAPTHPSPEEIWQKKIKTSRRTSWLWIRGYYRRQEDIEKRSLLKIDLPLFDSENRCIGNLVLMKDIRVEPMSPYTLRRVEQLKRAMAGVLEKLRREEEGLMGKE